jgi:hypothetical protein
MTTSPRKMPKIYRDEQECSSEAPLERGRAGQGECSSAVSPLGRNHAEQVDSVFYVGCD